MSLSAAAFGAVAGIALAIVFTDPLPVGFLAAGLIAAGALEAQVALKMVRRDLRIVAQLMGAAALTAVAAMTYSVGTARMDRGALALWAINGLFATNQIVYVHLRIRQARTVNRKKTPVDKRVFLAGEFLTAVCLTLAWQIAWIPSGVLLAFAPLLIRGAIWCLRPNNRSLKLRRLGTEELAHGLVFAGLLIIAFK